MGTKHLTRIGMLALDGSCRQALELQEMRYSTLLDVIVIVDRPPNLSSARRVYTFPVTSGRPGKIH